MSRRLLGALVAGLLASACAHLPELYELPEDGIRYEVRSVSEADLANLHASDGPPSVAASDTSPGSARASERDDAALSEPALESTRGWDGPIDEAFVNVGRDDGVRTSDVQQALTSAGVSEDDTAYVRIRQRHTFIGVRRGLLDQVVSGLSGQTIAQRAIEAQPARPRQARR